MSVDVGRTNAALWANLYYYNPASQALEFQAAVRVGTDGWATFTLDHASDYAIVLDGKSHKPASATPVPWSNPFRDVAENCWYFDAVAYVHQNGLMNGTAAAVFSPDATTTRGQFVTTLHRLQGTPKPAGKTAFSDVSQDAYYADAVAWAAENGIVNGVDGSRFAPGEPITREQLAAALYRFARLRETPADVGAVQLLPFSDRDQVSGYAARPMSWALERGLLTGLDNGTLAPKAYATRAQIAAILLRFQGSAADAK